MTAAIPDIDALLSESLAGRIPSWPADWTDPASRQRVVDRLLFHGVAGLLVQRGSPASDWPEQVKSAIRGEALARSMWELQHGAILGPLLAQLAAAGHKALLIKGTALAYDVYDEPATRIRGDTDLWISASALDQVRQLLTRQGFEPAPPAPEAVVLSLQEVWTRRSPRGFLHEIDLHWSAVNSAALEPLFRFETCWDDRLPLPRLADGAFALGRADALLLACVHRAMHVASPYIVEGRLHYSGDRLIWAHDIHRLVLDLGEDGLMEAERRAKALGVLRILGDGLAFASRACGTPVPQNLVDRARASTPTAASRYLQSAPIARAGRDLASLPGIGARLKAALRRAFPSAAFLRGKYPTSGNRSIAALHLRRWHDFLSGRDEGAEP